MTEFTNETVSIEVAADGTIVVAGDIDMAGGPLLEASLRQALPEADRVRLYATELGDSAALAGGEVLWNEFPNFVQ